jgi:hypothetical protein
VVATELKVRIPGIPGCFYRAFLFFRKQLHACIVGMKLGQSFEAPFRRGELAYQWCQWHKARVVADVAEIARTCSLMVKQAA